MKSIPKNSHQPLSEAELAEAKATYEKERESPWAGRKESTTPTVFPYKFGDGNQPVILSFYNAPEMAIVILFDSELPLEHLDIETRCETHEEITSFREALDEIYDLFEETWETPPGLTDYRKAQLREEAEVDDEAEYNVWSQIINDGSTWAYA